MTTVDDADLIVTNARITTLDDGRSEATALAARDGRFVAVGSDADVIARRSARTQVIVSVCDEKQGRGCWRWPIAPGGSVPVPYELLNLTMFLDADRREHAEMPIAKRTGR